MRDDPGVAAITNKQFIPDIWLDEMITREKQRGASLTLLNLLTTRTVTRKPDQEYWLEAWFEGLDTRTPWPVTKARRERLAAQHDTGANQAITDACNEAVDYDGYVDTVRLLADLAEAGWRLRMEGGR